MIEVNQMNIFSQQNGFIPLIRELHYRKLLRGEHVTTTPQSDLYMLYLVQHGRILLEYRDLSIEVGSKQLVLIQPHLSCSVTALEAQTEILGLPFGMASSTNQETAHPLPNHSSLFGQQVSRDKKQASENFQPIQLLSNRYIHELMDCLQRLAREQVISGPDSAMMQRAIMIEILIYMQRGMQEEFACNNKVKAGKIRELIKLSRDYMIQNYQKDISMEEVAKTIFLSRGYFTRIFREETGMSPLSYLLQVRIAKACVLLQDHQIKVHSIANQVGFASPQRFNFMFRKQMNMTPLEYRRQYKGSIENENDFIDIEELMLEYARNSVQNE